MSRIACLAAVTADAANTRASRVSSSTVASTVDWHVRHKQVGRNLPHQRMPTIMAWYTDVSKAGAASSDNQAQKRHRHCSGMVCQTVVAIDWQKCQRYRRWQKHWQKHQRHDHCRRQVLEE